jgi:hypothetical protein
MFPGVPGPIGEIAMAQTLRSLVLVTVAAALVSGCAPSGGESDHPNSKQVEAAAASPTFSVTQTAPGPVLALQVLLTPQTATVQDARFMRLPLRKSGGESDMVVIGMVGDRIVHKYPIADPLNAQVEPNDKGLHQTLRLPQASIWIYMPATRIDVVEISPGRNDDSLPRGGRLDIGAVLGRLCANQRSIEECAARAVAATPTSPPPPGTR